MSIDFAAIKENHPLELVLESRYGIQLRKAAGGWTCCCPAHAEKTPSCHVNQHKQLWHCFGCGAGGSVLDLVMVVDGAKDAKEAAEILEGKSLSEEINRPIPATRKPVVHVERLLPSLPKCYRGEKRHFESVGKLRNLDPFAIRMAHDAGNVRFCVAYDQPAYAILDTSAACNVQVRRMDGHLWFDRAKVMGVKGNWAAWPVGLAHAVANPTWPILLCEGTGDFLAGWQVSLDAGVPLAPVAMFGSSNAVHDGALPNFEGRKIIIAQQHDSAGNVAAARWSEQLLAARAASVRIWTPPTAGHDLNDYISSGGNPKEIL